MVGVYVFYCRLQLTTVFKGTRPKYEYSTTGKTSSSVTILMLWWAILYLTWSDEKNDPIGQIAVRRWLASAARGARDLSSGLWLVEGVGRCKFLISRRLLDTERDNCGWIYKIPTQESEHYEKVSWWEIIKRIYQSYFTGGIFHYNNFNSAQW